MLQEEKYQLYYKRYYGMFINHLKQEYILLVYR